ncbi:1,25-dihydroxyvitamin D(3) 24-hydroxylase, mitochondrial-like isoform X2 [Gigantopelta aegis]|uniref:1,25-dihydroxyvitamin D(3) 24-hydroxylase, mitochondrial-like isoform X2 n=1 Tax=Gigantopelta aegis TaxID=1735272 RepID=UPI001B887C27|nr:1,25-dihydroxyvitamin D(3) 24-hydroxylase, mitochondrial-like isoform X2 [Gigantopelta aegis]
MAAASTQRHLLKILHRRIGDLAFFHCASTEQRNARPFDEIPHKKGYPLIGTSIETVQNIDSIHTFIWNRYKTLGPIFREKTVSFDMVYIGSEMAVEQLLRQESKYPQRTCLVPWTQYVIDAGEAFGVSLANHEDWYRIRRVVKRLVLNFNFIHKYTSDFNEVSRDFLDRLEHVRTEDNRITGLDTELFHWALESVCSLLLSRRLGCLSDKPDPELEQFIDAVFGMFRATGKVLYYPPWFTKTFLPSKWNEFKSAFDTIFRIARKYVDEKVEERMTNVTNEEPGFLDHLLSDDRMTRLEVYATLVELMAGAVDTTANVVQMILYELSRNPRVQQKLYDEVTGVVPEGEFPSAAQLQNMPYLKAVIKETLRLTPIVHHVVRDLEKDMIILGYHVPAKDVEWRS